MLSNIYKRLLKIFVSKITYVLSGTLNTAILLLYLLKICNKHVYKRLLFLLLRLLDLRSKLMNLGLWLSDFHTTGHRDQTRTINSGNAHLEKPHISMRPCHLLLLRWGDDARVRTAIGCRPDATCWVQSLSASITKPLPFMYIMLKPK